jgi:hypothetical protein
MVDVLDIASTHSLVLYDGSTKADTGNLFRRLYNVKSYDDMDDTTVGLLRREPEAMNSFERFLSAPNVMTIKEVLEELTRGRDILLQTRTFYEDKLAAANYSAVRRIGRRARKEPRRDAEESAEKKSLLDEACYSWERVVKKTAKSLLERTKICDAFCDVVMYLESRMRLKARKQARDTDFKGRAYEDTHADEKLVGTALGKAMEAEKGSVALVTRDSDLSYIFPIFYKLIMSSDTGGRVFLEKFRKTPVVLYISKDAYGEGDFEPHCSTEQMAPDEKFCIGSLPEAENRNIRSRVVGYMCNVHNLLSQSEYEHRRV